jgi:rubredoxin
MGEFASGDTCPQCKKGVLQFNRYDEKGGRDYPVFKCTNCKWEVRNENR